MSCTSDLVGGRITKRLFAWLLTKGNVWVRYHVSQQTTRCVMELSERLCHQSNQRCCRLPVFCLMNCAVWDLLRCCEFEKKSKGRGDIDRIEPGIVEVERKGQGTFPSACALAALLECLIVSGKYQQTPWRNFSNDFQAPFLSKQSNHNICTSP